MAATVIIVLVLALAVALTCLKYSDSKIARLKEENEYKDQLIEMMTTEEHLVEIGGSVKTLVVEVQTIKRGIYGDPINNVIGLIGRQELDEKRLGSLEEEVSTMKSIVPRVAHIESAIGKTKITKAKATGFTVILAAVVEALHQLKDWFIK